MTPALLPPGLVLAGAGAGAGVCVCVSPRAGAPHPVAQRALLATCARALLSTSGHTLRLNPP